ncbi:MAG: MATE family efflux transporter [Lachnospiraceae bacterium]|nr:MATE family efflux transporter [Lachnospiraceae bacterium]
MGNSSVVDMTKGDVTKHLLRFTVPLLIGNLIQQCYNIVDSIIVGQVVGSKALGAVGSVGNIMFIFFALCTGLAAGVGIIVSQHFGAENYEKVKLTITNSIYVVGGTGILMSVLAVVLAPQILSWMNTPADNYQYALDYMRITGAATIVVAFYNGISAILRALGDSKTPLIFLVVASILNVVLDLAFVMGMDMGVEGAALATAISQCVAALGSVVVAVWKNPFFRFRLNHFAIDKELVNDIFGLGIPVAGQNALISLSCILLQSVVNGYGTMVMAAYTATSKVEQLVHQPFNSLGQACSTFAGQNAGAGQVERVIEGNRKAMQIMSIFTLIMIVFFMIFGNLIIGLFVEEAEIIAIGATGLRIASVLHIALGIIYVSRGTLNGLGDARYALINGVCEVLGRVVFIAILTNIPLLGFWSVWLTNGFTWILAGATGYIRFKQGKWKAFNFVRKKEVVL